MERVSRRNAVWRPQRSVELKANAAQLLDINQPKISALVNYRLEGFSVERLMRFLNALDRDVEIAIRKMPRSKKRENLGDSGAAISCGLKPSTLQSSKFVIPKRSEESALARPFRIPTTDQRGDQRFRVGRDFSRAVKAPTTRALAPEVRFSLGSCEP